MTPAHSSLFSNHSEADASARGAVSSDDERTVRGTLRVMGWNFLEGGLTRPDANGRRRPHKARRDAAIALVKKLDPDILVLNEALGGHPSPQSRPYTDYGKLFGFDHHVAALYSGAWGNAILSRFRLTGTKTDLLYDEVTRRDRGWLAARVETTAGSLWIGTYHPHPERRPEQRRQDVAQLLDAIDGPAVFAGDLNATHPNYPLQDDRLLPILAHLQGAERAAASLKTFRDSGRMLLDEQEGIFPERGWKVADTGGVPSLPTALIRQPGDPGLCIDHMAVSPGLRVQRAWIETGLFTDEASDHYPVVADIHLG